MYQKHTKITGMFEMCLWHIPLGLYLKVRVDIYLSIISLSRVFWSVLCLGNLIGLLLLLHR